MSEVPQPWVTMPVRLRVRIEHACESPIRSVTTTSLRTNADVAVELSLASGATMLCQAVRTTHRGRMALQNHEASLAPLLPPHIAPPLAWHVLDDDWSVLGFQVPKQFRAATLRPGSPDLPAVFGLAHAISQIAPPVTGTVRPLTMWLEQQAGWHTIQAMRPPGLRSWERDHLDTLTTLEDNARHTVTSDALVHTNLQTATLLVTDDGAQACDWSHTVHGPAWADLIYLAIRLIHAGHTPHDAHTWVRKQPAWAPTDSTQALCLSAAISGTWEHQRLTNWSHHHASTAGAARQWTRHLITDTERT